MIEQLMDRFNEVYKAQVEAIVGRNVRLSIEALDDADAPIETSPYRFILRTVDGLLTVVAKFNISQLPGCCGVAISHGSSVAGILRQKGLGKLLNKVRIDFAGNVLGYGTVLCTDVTSNEASQKILKANGWLPLFYFKNPRSGNEVAIHAFDLTK